jgi:hypothetical protein
VVVNEIFDDVILIEFVVMVLFTTFKVGLYTLTLVLLLMGQLPTLPLASVLMSKISVVKFSFNSIAVIIKPLSLVC